MSCSSRSVPEINEAERTGASILIVDDDPEVRLILSEFLEDSGFNILQAESGHQALGLIVTNPELELVITDIRMPRMSGIELAEAATQQRPKLGVILISGYFVPQQVGYRFLRKPFRMAELRSAVQAELTALHERNEH